MSFLTLAPFLFLFNGITLIISSIVLVKSKQDIDSVPSFVILALSLIFGLFGPIFLNQTNPNFLLYLDVLAGLCLATSVHLLIHNIKDHQRPVNYLLTLIIFIVGIISLLIGLGQISF